MKLDGWKRIVRRDPCSYCGGLSGGVDHIETEPRDDAPENLTAACLQCNSAKLQKPLLLFLLAPKPPKTDIGYSSLRGRPNAPSFVAPTKNRRVLGQPVDWFYEDEERAA